MQWRLAGIYGWHESSNKMKTWDLSKHIGGYIDVVWMIIGVFNKVFYETEKNSRNPCDFGSIQQF